MWRLVTEAATPDVLRQGHRLLLTVLSAVFVVSSVAWLVLPAEGAQRVEPGSVAAPARQSIGADGVAGSTSVADPADPAGPAGPAGPAAPPGPVTWERTTPDPELPETEETGTDSKLATALGVSIPSIGVDSSFVPLGLDSATGELIPPDSYDVAGLFSDGPVPGEVGPAIIAGHVDSQAGPGVFYRLEEMAIGDLIAVSMSGGQRLDFRVLEVAQYPKTAFPTGLVYGPTPERELRLITCGGYFDASRRSYVDNIVVYAVLI